LVLNLAFVVLGGAQRTAGVAVRISIDLGLHLHSSAWVDVPEDVKTIRRRVWGVVCILDLLLSLQLGRPSAIFDAHWASEIPVTPPPPPDAGLPSSLETSVTATPQYFAYTSSLCLIISRINYQLYLSTPANEDQNIERLESLRRELDNWREALPSELRISIGHQASLPVLDVNLLYHVAIILLYRPLCVVPKLQMFSSGRSLHISVLAACILQSLPFEPRSTPQPHLTPY